MANAFELIADQLADPEAQWSLGTFGAIAEFMRDAGEPAELVREDPTAAVVTPRGGIRLQALPGLKPVAFETITTQSWSQRVAFCLPERESTMSRRTVLTELGPDAQALRGEDRAAVLFDLGLGVLQVDCCIRTSEATLTEGLRAHAGRSLFDHGNPAMGLILQHGPHRVFVTRAGRAEVYQAIPAPGGTAPEGPHTHVLPKLLAHGRTHARPSRSRRAGCPARISIRRTRCATAAAGRGRSTAAAMRHSSACCRGTATSSTSS